MNHIDFELYSAVVSGNNEALKELEGRLSVGDQLTSTNFTVLHLASQYGKIYCVEHILSAHPSLLLKLNSRRETPLHLAARRGHYNVAHTLIDAAKSSILQSGSSTYLAKREKSGSSTVLRFLIRTTNVELETALHEAVRYNHLNVVKLLVTEDPSQPHPPNKNDETPVYLASLRGYKDILKMILDKCASPTYGGPDGRTALHAAILNHGTECVELLLEKKKELIRVADNYGWTSFHYAAYNNHYKIIKNLTNADKSVAYLPDERYKRTPLHIAAYGGCVGVMVELLKYCPDSFDTVDGNGQNILHIAVKRNEKEMIQYILNNRKEINDLLSQKDENGDTPLHLMVKLGCYVHEVLNQNHVDWDILNGENLTPLDLITSNGDTFVADQRMITAKLIHSSNAKRHWTLRHILKEPDSENRKTLVGYTDEFKEKLESHRKMKDTHMIVAALIATVALTAGFAMPGGFDSNAGPNQGSPALLRKAAFKTFVVTDAIALLCSLSSLFIYFKTVMYDDARSLMIVGSASTLLNLLSIVAMMLAFITGTYAMLTHSLALAITVSVICSFFFLLVIFLFIVTLLK